MANAENIKAHQFKSGEARASESGRRGGLASGEAKRRKQSLKALVQALLDAPPPKWARKIGGVECDTYGAAIAAAIFQKAAQGETPAFRAICETLGEISDGASVEVHSPIMLGTIPAPLVEKAKHEHEARQLENMKP